MIGRVAGTGTVRTSPASCRRRPRCGRHEWISGWRTIMRPRRGQEGVAGHASSCGNRH